jgi:hypothetical protein
MGRISFAKQGPVAMGPLSAISRRCDRPARQARWSGGWPIAAQQQPVCSSALARVNCFDRNLNLNEDSPEIFRAASLIGSG